MDRMLSGVRADRAYSYRDLEKVANRVRGCLKFPADQALNPVTLFEDLQEIQIGLKGGEVVPLWCGVISIEDSEGFTRYDRRRHVIEILASIKTYDRLEARHPRAGYFVAHELGHCLLHTEQLMRLAQMPTHQQAAFHRGRAGHKAYEDTEWQANAFASALLMPAEGIRALEELHGWVTPLIIAGQFGVSAEAAQYRVELYRNRRDELLG